MKSPEKSLRRRRQRSHHRTTIQWHQLHRRRLRCRAIANTGTARSRPAIQIIKSHKICLRRASRRINGIDDVVVRATRRGCHVERKLCGEHIRRRSSSTEVDAPVASKLLKRMFGSVWPPAAVAITPQPAEHGAGIAPCSRHPVRIPIERIQHVVGRPIGEDSKAGGMKFVLMPGQRGSGGEQTNETRRGENQHTARKKGFAHASCLRTTQIVSLGSVAIDRLGRGRGALIVPLRSMLLEPPRESLAHPPPAG